LLAIAWAVVVPLRGEMRWANGSGEWAEAGNWTPDGPPGYGEKAIILADRTSLEVTYRVAASPHLEHLKLDGTNGGETTLEMAGGHLWTNSTWVGHDGAAVFRQTAGTADVGELSLATAFGTGTVVLLGGELTTITTQVGLSGSGRFEQSGGVHRPRELVLGDPGGGSGAYFLNGKGMLETELMRVNEGSRFALDGGTAVARGIASAGELDLHAGTLQVTGAGGLTLGLDGIAHDLSVPDGATLQVSGDVVVRERRTLRIGQGVNGGILACRALGIQGGLEASGGGLTGSALNLTTAAGAEPGSVLASGDTKLEFGTLRVGHWTAGNLRQTGAARVTAGNAYVGGDGSYDLSDQATLAAGHELLVGYWCGSGQMTVAGGRVETGKLGVGVDAVDRHGLLRIEQGEMIVRGDDVIIGDEGQGVVEISGGVLDVDQGSFEIGRQFAATGSVRQSGGTVMLGGGPGTELLVGVGWPYYGGGNGRYEISGGLLEVVNNVTVGAGPDATGRIVHSGGVHRAHHSLQLSDSPFSVGDYELSGTGRLEVKDLTVTVRGRASFTQSGGELVADQIRMAVGAPAIAGGYGPVTSTFEVSGGNLAARKISVNDYDYTDNALATFTQTGGSVRVTEVLKVGAGLPAANSLGTYTLAGGTLQAPSVMVGDGGNGRFTQSGGVVTLEQPGATALGIGSAWSSSGRYELSGDATLEVRGNITIGAASFGSSQTGELVQSGGSLQVKGVLSIAGTGSSYALSHGSFAADGIANQAGISQGGGTAAATYLTGASGQLGLSGDALCSVSSLEQDQVLITQGALLRMVTPAAATPAVVVKRIQWENTGALDLDSGAMLVRATAGTVDTAWAELLAAVVDGRNGGRWDGPGLKSTAAASARNVAGGEARSLAVVRNGSLATPLTHFLEQAVDAHTLIAFFTQTGDLNLDGTVDQLDHAAMDAAYALGLPASWATGDLDYDGQLGWQDFVLHDLAFLANHGPAAVMRLYEEHRQLFGQPYEQVMRGYVPDPGWLVTAAPRPGLAILLQWTAPPSAASGWEIQRALDSGFATGLTTLTLPAGVTSHLDPGLTPQTTFCYRIRALGAPPLPAFSLPVQATTPGRLDDWRWVHFGAPTPLGDGADLADPDHDGAVNLTEYACNLDPRVADARPLPAGGGAGLPVAEVGPDGQLRVTFLRRTAASLPGINQEVQFSSDLHEWLTAPSSPALIEPFDPPDPLWERVTVTDSATPGCHRFARSVVSIPGGQ
jgi:hypothetical protein